jgi:ATP synthase protein I
MNPQTPLPPPPEGVPTGAPPAQPTQQQMLGEVRRDSARLEGAERARKTLLAQTVFLGSLSLLFVLPLVGGAYLGLWLDQRNAAYGTGWTLNGIVLGLALGVGNVVVFIRKHG